MIYQMVLHRPIELAHVCGKFGSKFLKTPFFANDRSASDQLGDLVKSTIALGFASAVVFIMLTLLDVFEQRIRPTITALSLWQWSVL